MGQECRRLVNLTSRRGSCQRFSASRRCFRARQLVSVLCAARTEVRFPPFSAYFPNSFASRQLAIFAKIHALWHIACIIHSRIHNTTFLIVCYFFMRLSWQRGAPGKAHGFHDPWASFFSLIRAKHSHPVHNCAIQQRSFFYSQSRPWADCNVSCKKIARMSCGA